LETCEYWHSENVKGLSGRKEWAGLKSVVMTRNTVVKDGQTRVQSRFFISSLSLEVAQIARAIRVIGWWRVCIGIWM
jgi:hypothetical protein